MPGTDGQDLLALQKAIHSSNHQSSRQKDWHPEKMTEIQPHVSGIITSLYSNIRGTSRTFYLLIGKLHLTLFPILFGPCSLNVKHVPVDLCISLKIWTWMTGKRSETKCACVSLWAFRGIGYMLDANSLSVHIHSRHCKVWCTPTMLMGLQSPVSTPLCLSWHGLLPLQAGSQEHNCTNATLFSPSLKPAWGAEVGRQLLCHYDTENWKRGFIAVAVFEEANFSLSWGI